jgi:hypothetical protein
MTQAVCEAAQLFKEAMAEWRKAEHEATMRRAETYYEKKKGV